jgi:hypothetical protein
VLGEAILRIRVSSTYWGTWQGRDNEVENIIKGASTDNHIKEDVNDDIEHEGRDGHACSQSRIHVVLNINCSQIDSEPQDISHSIKLQI